MVNPNVTPEKRKRGDWVLRVAKEVAPVGEILVKGCYIAITPLGDVICERDGTPILVVSRGYWYSFGLALPRDSTDVVPVKVSKKLAKVYKNQ
jgi:hypothetical protein